MRAASALAMGLAVVALGCRGGSSPPAASAPPAANSPPASEAAPTWPAALPLGRALTPEEAFGAFDLGGVAARLEGGWWLTEQGLFTLRGRRGEVVAVDGAALGEYEVFPTSPCSLLLVQTTQKDDGSWSRSSTDLNIVWSGDALLVGDAVGVTVPLGGVPVTVACAQGAVYTDDGGVCARWVLDEGAMERPTLRWRGEAVECGWVAEGTEQLLRLAPVGIRNGGVALRREGDLLLDRTGALEVAKRFGTEDEARAALAARLAPPTAPPREETVGALVSALEAAASGTLPLAWIAGDVGAHDQGARGTGCRLEITTRLPTPGAPDGFVTQRLTVDLGKLSPRDLWLLPAERLDGETLWRVGTVLSFGMAGYGLPGALERCVGGGRAARCWPGESEPPAGIETTPIWPAPPRAAAYFKTYAAAREAHTLALRAVAACATP